MVVYKQIDCFNINMKFWKFLGIYPYNEISPHYNFYSKMFIFIFVIIYDVLLTLNFFFLPNNLDAFIGEMLFYFTVLSVNSKVLTFLFMRKKIVKLLDILESKILLPVTNNGLTILRNAKNLNIRYWKILAAISLTCNLIHLLSSLIKHLLLSVQLELPVSSYSFLSDEIRERLIYLFYFYQGVGIHFHMLYNLNIDSFLPGIMILLIAQLEILKDILTNVCNSLNFDHKYDEAGDLKNDAENKFIMKLNQTIAHYDEVSRFCYLIQQIFSVTLFVQFSVASCIICVCLFRFTLPATNEYYVFLATYMFIMVIQILVPCWIGTQIMDKSCLLSQAIYNCDWIPRPREFKSSLRLFVVRANRPLSITALKMFPLSLATFTSIMNTAYSFFTLLRHMQAKEN
ncbi:unnamed protein product [Parnassius mnemosyne]|uniref:Odorant receptor n=1 Tax=Parnassius mnemosyne TaxID=213953 RepID=A0AAV1M264_9NEOP